MFRKWKLSNIFLFALKIAQCIALPSEVRILGIFDDTERELDIAFEEAVSRVNHENLLGGSRLTAIIETVVSDDSFMSSKKVCEHLKSGVFVIFGPQTWKPAVQIRSLSSAFRIPFIETRQSYDITRDSFSINFYPHYTSISQAIDVILKNYDWQHFSYIYDTNEGWLRAQSLFKNEHYKIMGYKLYSGGYAKTLSDAMVNHNILLDIPPSKVKIALAQAKLLGILNSEFSYFIISLDTENSDLEDFFHSGANITVLRMTDAQKLRLLGRATLTSSEAMIYDAVELVVKSLHTLDQQIRVEPPNIDCERSNIWNSSSNLMDIITRSEINGFSGDVMFDDEGFRSNITLQLYEMMKSRLQKVASWNVYQGLRIEKVFTRDTETKDLSKYFINRTLTITTILQDPYTIETSPNEFKGFCIDLIDLLAQKLKFKYKVRLVSDGKYGILADGEWNGMIGEVIRKEADLAVAPLTITSLRELVVDFTRPFLHVGLGVITHQYKKPNFNFNFFIVPFTFTLWLCILVSFFIIIILLTIIFHYNPHDDSLDIDSGFERNLINMFNNMWFAIRSFGLQGSHPLVKSMSLRLLFGFWWFFCIFIISLYLANLSAVLVIERKASPLKTIDDLMTQRSLQFGCLMAGSTRQFFKNTINEPFKQIDKEMYSNPNLLVSSIDEGIQRVRKMDNYAFFGETTTLHYVTNKKPCNTQVITALNTNQGYGIATQQNSVLREAINLVLLEFEENGNLQRLENKWWYDKQECLHDQNQNEGIAEILDVSNLSGLFIVLFSGIVLSAIILLLECILNRERSYKTTSEVKS